MIKVTLVGTGTVSDHLSQAFSNINSVRVIQILSSRNIVLTASLDQETDVYIIAVSDDAISSVSQEFIKSQKLVVHTSGSMSISALPARARRGIFYPLQTFSKGRKVDFSTIPICIEAEKLEDLELLKELAKAISNNIHSISSKQRASIHLSAVFVNNFTNHMFQIANRICNKNDVPFEILRPLITETAAKLEELTPFEAQTGPAKRNDHKTIEKHLSRLQNTTSKEVYQTLTKSIQETHGKEL